MIIREVDIVPELKKAMDADFNSRFNKSEKIKKLYAKIRDGTATYSEAHLFADELSGIISDVFASHLSSDILPEGKMFYNIANRLIAPAMEENYKIVAEVARLIQEALNKKAGLGVKALAPELNADKVKGIVNKVSTAENFDDVSFVLKDPVNTFTRSVIDDTVKRNAEFQHEAGLPVKVVRTAHADCCDWCKALAGTYDYEDVRAPGNDVFRRHENCKCVVTFVSSKGAQNAHSKKRQAFSPSQDAALRAEERKKEEQKKADVLEKAKREENRQFWIKKLMEERGYSAKRAAIYYNKNRLWLEGE